MLKTRKTLASTLLVSLVSLGTVIATSPAWAATCQLGANNPTSSNYSKGGRYNCGGSVTLEVRNAKVVSFSPDPYNSVKRSGFTSGDLGVQGTCKSYLGGATYGSYYTWTVSSSGNQIESGRVTQCG